MRNCQQTPTQNVLQHGLSVARYFKDIRDHILFKNPLQKSWKLPDWITNPALWQSLFDYRTIIRYQIYHDCGKPYCLTIDPEGKRHFPNHADVSSQIWFDLTGSEQEARLMKMDMDLHTMSAVEIEDFKSCPEAATLLITALCEVHSNAEMFGGIESTSFKIKWKKINQHGKKIIQYLKRN